MKPVSWKAMIVFLMVLLMSISSACADRLGDAYTDAPPAEVLSHLEEKFGAYLLEDYIAIAGTPQGDYGFALLSRKAERVLVGYHRDEQQMAYGLKNAGAVPQGEGYVFFQRHSAEGIISFGNSDATYPDALGFDVIRIEPANEEYWSQSVSYHWEKGGFKLQDYMDRSEGHEAAYVTDDGVRYYDFTYAEPRGYVEGSVQRNLRYVSFSALPKTKAQAKEKLTWPNAVSASIVRSTALTDDPLNSQTALLSLPQGSKVMCLAVMGDWAYVETTEGEWARGFVPRDALNCEPGL